ncbi:MULTISPECIES: hypothetical protein [Bacillus cereus group]|uniref:hypothetical protein n=1 Tax=Bacillus cereus group TaxID=86661 RepID=UPI0003A54606|nr:MULTISPECIES: hypothetical protein [Bacillus cereus group]MCZ6940552.1 hypothetical protein [Bacillus mycoides]
MVKNLPLLLSMFVIGCALQVITSTVKMIPYLEWTLRGGAVILIVWSMIALMLHVSIYGSKK